MNKFEAKKRFDERMKRCYPPGIRILRRHSECEVQ